MKTFKLWQTLALGILAASPLRAEPEEPIVKLGIINRGDAHLHDAEFQQYDRMQPDYKRERIEASLMRQEPFWKPGMSREKFDSFLAGYHMVSLTTTNEGIFDLTPQLRAHGRMVGEALTDYVKQGGGLLLHIVPLRYPATLNNEYWNIVFEPLGVQILREGVFDTTRTVEAATMARGGQVKTFWFTQNFSNTDSPILKEVRGLCLPAEGQTNAGVPALKYTDDWNILVRGETEAKSYKILENNSFATEEVGTYTEAPPVVATRSLGKGRIVSYPLPRYYSGMNRGTPVWREVVESRGVPEKNWPSDSIRLQLNAYRWLGEPAVQNQELGTHRVVSSEPVQYDEAVSFDENGFRHSLFSSEQTAKGILGARSKFGGGQGTVAEYVAAAKEAGLKFIVFTDPLEKLTTESLEALKKACAEASKDGDFYACPGVQFTDSAGIPWVIWGERIVFPTKEFEKSGKTYPLWDGKRILARGYYMMACGGGGSAVLSYKQLRENGTHPENLWWFHFYFPKVYEDNKLVEDHHEEYFFGLRDLRRVALASYTGIDSPEKVQGAADLFTTNFANLKSVRKGLNTFFGKNIPKNSSYVSEGPEILGWRAINSQMEENWQYTRGAQRVRLRLDVASEKGIQDVKIHDADLGVLHRYEGHGATSMSEEIEVAQDKQHYLTLEVTDVEGKKAFTSDIRVYAYKQGLFRCSDNLNILGPLGILWHPDRNEFFAPARDFQQAKLFSVKGLDTGRPILPMPKLNLEDTVNIEGVGAYPSPDNAPGMTSKLMDVELASHNIQIATMTLENLAERFNTEFRPAPAQASSPKDVGENEYFRRIHRIIAPMDRIDWYTAWNHRRIQEGLKDYQGSITWHEGEIEFKKDVVLKDAVPIPLLRIRNIYDSEEGYGTVFAIAEKPGETKEIPLTSGEKERFEGSIGAGGFISQLPTLVGYSGFYPLDKETYTYKATFFKDPERQDEIIVGLGHDGQEVKAGTVFKYRFAVAAFTDTEPNAKLLGHTAETLNFGGGRDGYPIKTKIGEVKDANSFLTVEATDGEAKFSVGPEKLIIDLPMVVEGIEDNGCAAVFSTNRPWFRFVSVADGKAWFQEPMDNKNEIWVGNIFQADNKDVRLTMVIDGQDEGRPPFLQIHNPSAEAIETTLRSPENTPEFGGMSVKVSIPAGTTIRLNIEDGTLTPDKEGQPRASMSRKP